jgi:hypothetical protein
MQICTRTYVILDSMTNLGKSLIHKIIEFRARSNCKERYVCPECEDMWGKRSKEELLHKYFKRCKVLGIKEDKFEYYQHSEKRVEEREGRGMEVEQQRSCESKLQERKK